MRAKLFEKFLANHEKFLANHANHAKHHFDNSLILDQDLLLSGSVVCISQHVVTLPIV